MNKSLFTEKKILPGFIKQESYSSPALYLLKRLCLKYVQYENPPKKCIQNINHAINQTITYARH